MLRRLGAGILLLGALLLGGCVFGGGDGGDDPPSVSRPSSIPTATPPANLPEPVLLTSSSSPTGTTGTTGAATGGPAPGTYVVKSGDTLFAIASSLGVPSDGVSAWTAEVLRLNQLASAATLKVGQELTLPVSRTPTPAATTANRTPTPGGSTPAATATRAPSGTTPAPTATTGGGASSRTYTVVSGDYPLLIAEKLNVPEAQRNAWANELLSLNATTAAALDVGDVLRLPASTP